MCFLVYTNYQRQGAVINMTMGELDSAETKGDLKVVSVWDHKTAAAHGAARIMGFVLFGVAIGSLESTQASLIYMIIYVISGNHHPPL